MNKLPIELNVGGHKIRLKVGWEQEEIYRKAQRMINETYETYLQKYPQKSIEELWVLTALHYAVTANQQQVDSSVVPLMAKVEEIDAEIERLLQDITI